MPVLLLLLLLPAATAQAQPADCAAVPVGPPIDIELYVDATGRSNATAPGRITAGLGLTRLPAFGSRCAAPPPRGGDVLRGPDPAADLLRPDESMDLLAGPGRAGEVVIGPARPVEPGQDPVRP